MNDIASIIRGYAHRVTHPSDPGSMQVFHIGPARLWLGPGIMAALLLVLTLALGPLGAEELGLLAILAAVCLGLSLLIGLLAYYVRLELSPVGVRLLQIGSSASATWEQVDGFDRLQDGQRCLTLSSRAHILGLWLFPGNVIPIEPFWHHMTSGSLREALRARVPAAVSPLEAWEQEQAASRMPRMAPALSKGRWWRANALPLTAAVAVVLLYLLVPPFREAWYWLGLLWVLIAGLSTLVRSLRR
jgi:hypothetical protein